MSILSLLEYWRTVGDTTVHEVGLRCSGRI